MSPARLAYTALVYSLLPYALVRIAWRSRRERGYLEHVAERFGRYDVKRPPGRLIWLHAVSLGETRAAEPLVRALQRRYPTHRMLLTHMTPSGRHASQTLFGDDVIRCYLPYDYPGAVDRFLDHFEPAIGLLMETELWPNLIQASRARGVPLYLVNARLSEKSLRGYQRLGAIAREATSSLTGIAAQTTQDAQRLQALGARAVSVTGSVKFDATPALQLVELGKSWRKSFGIRRVLLAASTRDGEESLVLDAWSKLPDSPLLVLVPRHPQRFDEVATLLERRGVRYARRSVSVDVSRETQVLLGDSMGEMAAYFSACDVAFVGGSLLPYGAHNFIEACALGKPVLLGPHTYNFAEAAERAISAGAALRVSDADELAAAAARLLGDPGAASEMGQRGVEFSRAHQGATERVLAILRPSLDTANALERERS
jgi:3-deoxy-D-manno-octulosonic-acid transferase